MHFILLFPLLTFSFSLQQWPCCHAMPAKLSFSHYHTEHARTLPDEQGRNHNRPFYNLSLSGESTDHHTLAYIALSPWSFHALTELSLSAPSPLGVEQIDPSSPIGQRVICIFPSLNTNGGLPHRLQMSGVVDIISPRSLATSNIQSLHRLRRKHCTTSHAL